MSMGILFFVKIFRFFIKIFFIFVILCKVYVPINTKTETKFKIVSVFVVIFINLF